MNQQSTPDFCLSALNHPSPTICSSEFRGKVVLLSFWVTWCPACVADLPQKEVFHQSLRHSDLLFYTINVTGREADPSQVPSFLEEHGYTFPVLIDQGTNTYDAFRITSVPTTILVDQQGKIRGQYDETTPFMHVLQKAGQLLDS